MHVCVCNHVAAWWPAEPNFQTSLSKNKWDKGETSDDTSQLKRLEADYKVKDFYLSDPYHHPIVFSRKFFLGGSGNTQKSLVSDSLSKDVSSVPRITPTLHQESLRLCPAFSDLISTWTHFDLSGNYIREDRRVL